MIERLSQLDLELLLLINSLSSTRLNPLMVWLSGQVIWIPFIMVIFWVAFKNLEKKSFYLFVLFIFLGLMASDVSSSYLMKNLVQRMRPCRIKEIHMLLNNFGQKCGGRFGFVSSHAANAFSILVFFFKVIDGKFKKFWPLWLLPLAVSYSRIYLGVHYPGDILGGIVIGTFWGYVLATFFERRELGSKSA